MIHAAGCQAVRELAAAGAPVATLFGCKALPSGLPLAGCMNEAARRSPVRGLG